MQKNLEVFKEDFNSLWIISKLFVFNEWKEIAKASEEIFKSKVIINPLFEDKALIKTDNGRLEELIEKQGKWQEYGPFHLLFKKWNRSVHSRPTVLKGYGGWMSIKNLPLDYWSRDTFEAIGAYFGGLENIATDTLNLLNCSEAKIKV